MPIVISEIEGDACADVLREVHKEGFAAQNPCLVRQHRILVIRFWVVERVLAQMSKLLKEHLVEKDPNAAIRVPSPCSPYSFVCMIIVREYGFRRRFYCHSIIDILYRASRGPVRELGIDIERGGDHACGVTIVMEGVHTGAKIAKLNDDKGKVALNDFPFCFVGHGVKRPFGNIIRDPSATLHTIDYLIFA